jgi:hypothetical protein
VLQQLGRFAGIVAEHCSRTRGEEQFDRLVAAVEAQPWPETDRHLVEFPGKDLLRALEPWIVAREPRLRDQQLRTQVRDFVVNEPAQALALVPDWAALVAELQRPD